MIDALVRKRFDIGLEGVFGDGRSSPPRTRDPEPRAEPLAEPPDPPRPTPEQLRRVNLDRLLRSVPAGVAAAVLELSSGTPLATGSLDNHKREAFDLLAAATTELFHDATVTSIETMDVEHRDSARDRLEALQQIIVQSKHLLYVFLRSQRQPNLVLATLCRADANLGLVLLATRDALRDLEASL